MRLIQAAIEMLLIGRHCCASLRKLRRGAPASASIATPRMSRPEQSASALTRTNTVTQSARTGPPTELLFASLAADNTVPFYQSLVEYLNLSACALPALQPLCQ